MTVKATLLMTELPSGSVSEAEALLRLYQCLNHPACCGPKWVRYSRGQADAALDVIKQLMELHGIKQTPHSKAQPGFEEAHFGCEDDCAPD